MSRRGRGPDRTPRTFTVSLERRREIARKGGSAPKRRRVIDPPLPSYPDPAWFAERIAWVRGELARNEAERAAWLYILGALEALPEWITRAE